VVRAIELVSSLRKKKEYNTRAHTEAEFGKMRVDKKNLRVEAEFFLSFRAERRVEQIKAPSLNFT